MKFWQVGARKAIFIVFLTNCVAQSIAIDTESLAQIRFPCNNYVSLRHVKLAACSIIIENQKSIFYIFMTE